MDEDPIGTPSPMNGPGSFDPGVAERRVELLEVRVQILPADARAEPDALLPEMRAALAGLRRMAGPRAARRGGGACSR